MRRLKTIFACMLMAVLSIGQVWGADVTGTINFGSASGNTNVNAASVTGDDSQGNTWTVTTAGTTSFTPNPAYAQIGSSKKPATSVTFTTTLAAEQTISAFSASFGGFSSTAGTVTLKVGETTVGTGFLNATNDVTVSATKTTAGTVLTVEVTGIAKGVKAYSISYTYSTGGGDPDPSVTVDPEDWDFGAVATDASASKVFSVSGSNLTAGTLTLTAPSGYSVSPASITVASAGDLDATNVTVSKNTSTAGTYNGNLTISGCGLEDDVEVALAMEVKAKYTVTWNNNGVTSTSQVLDGEKPVFPATPASCDATSTTFIGWATAPWTGKLANLDDKTVYTKAADMPAVGAAVTYYAVFAKSSGSAGNLLKWEGGTSSALTALENVTASGLGSDYAATNAPYRVKFDTEGDYIVITTSGAIESVAVGVKMLGGGSTSHIYVQEAEDAESDFSAVETLTISGAQNDVIDLETENAFKADSRAVKLLFNKGSNVGVGPITIAGAASASDYMTTCCTKYAVNIAAGIEHGSISADLASACEGATVTLTFTPATNYHLSGWTLNGVAQDVNANTFSMPAGAATVSATFEQDACDPLATPVVTVSGKAYPYNAVKLAWSAITNADSYKVYIYDAEDNELEHNDAFTGVEYTIGQTLGGSTTYKYSVQAVSNTPATYCPSTEAESTFTTDALPTAHLTLMNLGVEHASSGDYAILTPFNLPTTAAACSKEFVGWDANPDCAIAPTYVKGDEFTFSNTTGVTLYAVYADVTGGGASYTLTPAASVSEGVYVIAAYDTNYKAFTGEVTTGTNNDLSNETTGFTIDGGKKIESLPAEACEFTFTAVSGGFSISKANGDYLGYSSTNSRKIAFATSHSDKVWNATALSKDGYPDDGLYISTSAYKISGNGSSPSLGRGYGSNTYNPLYLFKKTTTPGTPSNYSTTCAAAPEVIIAPEEINATAAAVAAGVIEAAYDNVDEENLAVALYNDQACTEAFDGGWLTASINGDNNIAYTIAENTSYNDARTAYIKLTAPETTGATDPAVVIIPVSQAKKAAVFSSLAELAAADVNANTNVTVTLTNVVIKEFYEYNDKVCGVVFNIQKAGEDIKIYFNNQTTIGDWVAGGKLSGTLTDCPWKTYNDAWQLAPTSGWAWANLEYTEPASVSSVAVSGTPSKTTYNTGEAFDPAGLTVTVTYSDESVEAITSNDANWAYVSWNIDPATFAAEHIGTGKSVSVTATYNAVASSAAEISGLTVNKVAVTGVTLNQDVATLKAGKTLTLTAIVAPANASIKSVNWSTSDGSIATVDNGVVTAVAEGSATITATSTDDNTKTASCAITVVAGINFAAGDWTLVTDAAELTAGSYVIIAAAGYDKAMKSYESGNNCKAEDATKSGDLLTYDEDFGIFEVGDYEISDVTYKTFQDAETDQYLYISSNENRLQAQDTKNENAAWTITSVSDAGKAVVTSKSQSSRTMRYNDNSDLFACYASGQKDIALYKYYAPVPKVTYNKNTEDEVTGLPAVQKTEWETDAYKATVAAGPSRTGYTFTGWNSAAEGKGDAYAAGTKYSFAEDITLYAQWEALTAHHVTYVTVGTAPTDEDSYYVGDYVTLASAAGLSNPGYVFDGWNDGTSTYAAGFNEYEMPDNDVTFTAVWSRKSSQKWVLVTDVANIKTDGTEYVIAGAEHNVAMGALNGSYYNSTSVTKNDNILTGTEQMIALTFEDGSEDGKLAIKHDTKYIYSTTVKNMGERDDSFDWEIVIADGVATISASVGYLKYNSQNPRFNTYASGQQPVAIYEKAENVVVTTSQAVSGISAGADVIVKNGGTLNVDADKSIGDLTVEAGGTVALSSNKLTVVGTFAIETSMATQNLHKSGQVTGATASNFEASEAYIDITLGAGATGDQWHAFTVPFPVDALNGIYDLDGGKLTNEVHYAIMDYHGDIRATGKYGWKKYRKTLVPGTFYLMTVDGLRTTYRFKKAAGAALVAENSKTIYEYAASGDGEDSDAGWNGVGNPTLSYGQVNVPVQVLDPDAYEYVTKTANSTNFVVGTPFFYKAGADGSISMVEASGIVNYAPARRTVREIKDVDITFGNEAYKDHLYISASEDALNSYEQDKDLVKMRMSKTPKVAQIMAEAYGCELSMVNAPMVNGEARYALSLYAPAAGEYTISSDAMALAEDGSQLYLTYNGYPMWNLTSSPMTVTLPKGNSTQFGLLITHPALMPTGVDEVTGDGLQVTGVEKLIIDDHIYILRDGKMYDVTGKAVK